eukprot:gene49509-27295_t
MSHHTDASSDAAAAGSDATLAVEWGVDHALRMLRSPSPSRPSSPSPPPSPPSPPPSPPPPPRGAARPRAGLLTALAAVSSAAIGNLAARVTLPPYGAECDLVGEHQSDCCYMPAPVGPADAVAAMKSFIDDRADAMFAGVDGLKAEQVTDAFHRWCDEKHPDRK